MATCFVCEKKRFVGRKVSHSNVKTKLWKFPNLQHVKALLDGTPKYIYACTRCLRSGFVTKAP